MTAAAALPAPTPDQDNPLWGADWAETAALWPLQPGVTHVNHGSFGGVPSPVLEEQQRWRARMETNPVRFFARDVADALITARGEVATFLGLDGEDDVAFVPNATTGVNTVLAAAGLAAGDEVLLTDRGYGAVRIAADRVCAAAGARVVVVPLPLGVDDDALVDSVLAAVTPRTRMAVIDHITSSTARRMPVERLVPALQERGVAVCVDAAHAPGMLEVDLQRMAPDWWTGNLHKWACAARGTAVLYAGPTRRRNLRPLVASWNDHLAFPRAFDLTGTADVSAWLSAPAALRLLESLGWDRVRAHNAQLVCEGQAVVTSAVAELGCGGPAEAAVAEGGRGLPMALVPLAAGLADDAEQAADLQRRIAERCDVEVAVTSFGGQGLIRLSAQVYNCPADYDVLAQRLPAALAR